MVNRSACEGYVLAICLDAPSAPPTPIRVPAGNPHTVGFSGLGRRFSVAAVVARGPENSPRHRGLARPVLLFLHDRYARLAAKLRWPAEAAVGTVGVPAIGCGDRGWCGEIYCWLIPASREKQTHTNAQKGVVAYAFTNP